MGVHFPIHPVASGWGRSSPGLRCRGPGTIGLVASRGLDGAMARNTVVGPFAASDTDGDFHLTQAGFILRRFRLDRGGPRPPTIGSIWRVRSSL